MRPPTLPAAEGADVMDYVAGLVDADGSIFISQGAQSREAGGAPSHRLCVTVVTTNRDLAAWLRDALDGRLNDVGRNKDHHLRRWRWERTRESAAELLGELENRLALKARQAALGQRFREDHSSWPRGRALTDAEIERRNAWQEALRSLNRLEGIPASLGEELAGSRKGFMDWMLEEVGRELTHPLTEGDWRYLAGLFDGDGGIDLIEIPGDEDSSPQHRLKLHLTTSGDRLAGRIADLFGASVRILEGEDATRPSYKVIFRRVRVMLRFIRGVLPYSARAGELELTRDFLEATHPYGTGGPGRTVPEATIESRRALQEAVRRLRSYRPLNEELVRSLAGSPRDFERRYPRAWRTSEWLREAEWNEAGT